MSCVAAFYAKTEASNNSTKPQRGPERLERLRIAASIDLVAWR